MSEQQNLRATLEGWGRTYGRFIRDAVRVLFQHWPALICLFLIGWIGRMGFLWISIIVSNWSPTVAVLILPLAPMSMLLAFILMLRVMTRTLPAFSELASRDTATKRWTEDFTAAGQVMIPFLAVYASAGLLSQDVSVFLVDSATDEWLNTAPEQIDFGRADYAPGWTIILFIVVALVLRKIISVKKLAQDSLAWAGFAAYLEVLWIITLAQAFASQISMIQDWVTSRRFVADIMSWVDSALATVREWSTAISAVLDAIGSTIGSLGAVVVVPVAWLATGAAVYGYQLHSAAFRVPGHEQASKQISRVPGPIRRAVSQVFEPIVTPIQSAFKAVLKVAAAGVVPMILFCLTFLLATGLQPMVAFGARLLIGPSSPERIYALEPYVIMVERGVYFVIVLCLLAAAVSATVLAQREETPETTEGHEEPTPVS
ncbi:MAG: hypothetical protein WAS54_02250 [Scrofimicrobium sp.]